MRRTSARRRLVAILFVVCLCGSARAATAQKLVPLVTDQTPMSLANTFGVPSGSVVNDAGDYAFIGQGASAVFLRRHDGPTIRVIQVGDELPGVPGSRAAQFSGLQLNSAGVIAFDIELSEVDGRINSVIVTFDGTSIHKIISSADSAP